MPGDNFQVIVHSCGFDHFEAAVRMCFANAPGGKASHYVAGLPERGCIECCGSGKDWRMPPEAKLPKESVVMRCDNCKGSGKVPARDAMVLLWSGSDKAGMEIKTMPFPAKVDAAVKFLWDYLEQCEYPNEPDHDGSNKKGFFVTSGDYWGHVEGLTYSILMVAPEWQMYGK